MFSHLAHQTSENLISIQIVGWAVGWIMLILTLDTVGHILKTILIIQSIIMYVPSYMHVWLKYCITRNFRENLIFAIFVNDLKTRKYVSAKNRTLKEILEAGMTFYCIPCQIWNPGVNQGTICCNQYTNNFYKPALLIDDPSRSCLTHTSRLKLHILGFPNWWLIYQSPLHLKHWVPL